MKISSNLHDIVPVIDVIESVDSISRGGPDTL